MSQKDKFIEGADSSGGADSSRRRGFESAPSDESPGKKYFVYMLSCSNGSFYTGYTTDVEKRYEKHLAGKTGAKFTRGFKPVAIAAAWNVCGTRGDAMRVESFIKGLERSVKEKISKNPAALQGLLAEKYSIEVNML